MSLLTYTGIIPASTSIDLKSIVDSFCKRHQEYELSKVEYSGDSCSAIIRVSEKEYVANYIEMWRDRLLTIDCKTSEIFSSFLRILRKECDFTIHSSGAVEIKSDAVSPSQTIEFEFVYSEMKWVFRFIHFALIDALAATHMGNFDDLKRWSMYNVECFQEHPAGSSDWIVKNLREISEEERTILKKRATEFLGDFRRNRFPFVFQGPLRKWQNFYDECSRRVAAAKRSKASIKRLNNTMASSSDVVDAETYIDLLSEVGKRAEFILDIFTNRLTVASLSIALGAFAAGLFPFAIQGIINIENLLAVIPLLLLIGAALFVWRRPVGHQLINMQMQIIDELLE